MKVSYTIISSSGPYQLKILTLGYSVLNNDVEYLKHIVSKYDGIIVDVRLNPYSRFHYAFNKNNLIRELGNNYIHIEELGNLNYISGGEYKLKNEPVGLTKARRIMLYSGRNPILFCAEKDPRKCHRTYIARKLAGSRHIVHLVKKDWFIPKQTIEVFPTLTW